MRQICSIAIGGSLHVSIDKRRSKWRLSLNNILYYKNNKKKIFLRKINLIILSLFVSITANAEEMQFAEPDFERPVKSIWEIRSNKVVMQKWDMSCGAAALATIMNYQYNDPVDERVIAKTMLQNGNLEKIKAQHGFSLLDLKKFAETRGYIATGYKDLSIEELSQLRFAIVPVIEFGSNPHFIVVREIRNDGTVDIADSAFGNRLVPVEEFKQSWEGNFAFILERSK